jgi:hypothetical protein
VLSCGEIASLWRSAGFANSVATPQIFCITELIIKRIK